MTTKTLRQGIEYSDVGELVIPYESVEGSIIARHATKISAPLLKTCRFISAEKAVEFSAPVLTTSGSLELNSAETISLPELIEAQRLIFQSVLNLQAPKLKYAQSIYASKATFMHLPSLLGSEELELNSVKEFIAENLETVDREISLEEATKAHFPKLKQAGTIYLPKADPKLKNLEWLTGKGGITTITTKNGTFTLPHWRADQNRREEQARKALRTKEGLTL